MDIVCLPLVRQTYEYIHSFIHSFDSQVTILMTVIVSQLRLFCIPSQSLVPHPLQTP